MMSDIRICPECGKEVERADMNFSKDCHGITMRLLCHKCLDKIYATRGYDGVYYSDADEQIDSDY